MVMIVVETATLHTAAANISMMSETTVLTAAAAEETSFPPTMMFSWLLGITSSRVSATILVSLLKRAQVQKWREEERVSDEREFLKILKSESLNKDKIKISFHKFDSFHSSSAAKNNSKRDIHLLRCWRKRARREMTEFEEEEETMAPTPAPLSSNTPPLPSPSTTTTKTASGKKEQPKPRLVIKSMVLENFKSYAGAQHVGPFHKVRTSFLLFF